MSWEAAAILGSAAIGATANAGSGHRSYRNASKMHEKQVKAQNELFTRQNKRLNRQNKFTRQQVRLGNRLDMRNQKEMFDYRIQQGMDQGMTAYEMFMGPAGGAGGGTNASGQTLGNAASQSQQQQNQLQQQAIENQKDRDTQLMQAQIAADAQKYSAQTGLVSSLGSSKISADASTHATDTNAEVQREGQKITEAIAANKLKLDRDTYENVTLPQVAAQMDMTKAETEKALSEVALNDKDYRRAMAQMQMGVDNVYAEGILKQAGVSPTMSQEDWDKIPMEKREAAMSALAAARSTTAAELRGIKDILVEFVTWLRDSDKPRPRKQPKPLGNAVPPSPQNRTGNWAEG